MKNAEIQSEPCDLCGGIAGVMSNNATCCIAAMYRCEAARTTSAMIEMRLAYNEMTSHAQGNEGSTREAARLRIALEQYRDYGLVGRGRIAAMALDA